MKQKDLEVFLNYLKEKYSIENDFTQKMITNLIDFVYREYGNKKGAARNIIHSILPQIRIEELEKYLPDFDEWKIPKQCIKEKNNI